MGPHESALLRRFCTGADAEAFAELVQRYAGLVYSTCWRVLKDETDAADATQETFFELTRHANRVSGSLAGWLHRVATQKSIDLRRRCASRRRREEVYARTQPVEVHSWQDLSHHVDLALDELDDATKSLLLERFVLGKSAVQIAREHGTSQATISRRIAAGLAQLRGVLRRKGLLVATGAVATVLTESASQAVSVTALHGLGKMAMVGTTEATTAGVKAGLAEAVVAAVVIGVLSMGVYMHRGRSAPPVPTPSVQTHLTSSIGTGESVLGIDRMAVAADPPADAPESISNPGPLAVEQKQTAQRDPGPPDILADDRPLNAKATVDGSRPVETSASDLPPTPARILRFPTEHSIGVVYLQDDNLTILETVKGFDLDQAHAEMETFSCARGEVHIPAGKRVILCIRGTGVTPELYLATLKSLGPDDLYGLRLFSLHPIYIADNLIDPVARLTGLRMLDFASVSISRKSLSSLACLPHIERFSTPVGLTNEKMAEIVKMPSLRVLHVGRNRLTDEGLQTIGTLTSLESLDLHGNPAMTDDGLGAIAQLDSLQHFRLTMGTPFNDHAMTHLAALPSLKVLWLDGPNITDEGLRRLSASHSLERVCLRRLHRITGRGVEHLSKMTQLKALDITSDAFTEEDLAAITAMVNLEHLVLPRCTFTDAGISRLATMKQLKCLQVNCSDNSPLTDDALAAIGQMHELAELHIGGAGFTNDGIALLRSLEHLSALHLAFWPGLDNDTLRLLAQFPALRELSWSTSDHVTLSGLNELNGLVDLESLSATHIHQDRRGLDLSGLRKLTNLRIHMRNQTRKVANRSVTASEMFYDNDLACLSGLTDLRTLSLQGRGIGDAGVAYIAPLKKLRHLEIGGSAALTDEGLRHLADMGRIDCLRIGQSRIGGRGLQLLHPLKTIHILAICSTVPIDPEAITQLQTELPHLQSLNIGRSIKTRLGTRHQSLSASRYSYWGMTETMGR